MDAKREKISPKALPRLSFQVMRSKNFRLEPRSDSIGTEKALESVANAKFSAPPLSDRPTKQTQSCSERADRMSRRERPKE
jgi:hypothetical protein